MTNEKELLSNEAIQQQAREAASTLAWCYGVLTARGAQSTVDSEFRRLSSMLSASQEQTCPTGNSIFRQLQSAIDDGTYLKRFPVGTILPDTWIDPNSGVIYNMPLRIVDYREVTLANGKSALGAILLRVNSSPNRIIFDPDAPIYSRSYVQDYLNSTYLDGCSTELLDAIVVTCHKSIYGVEEDIAQGWMFLPTPEELHANAGDYSDAEVDRLAWEYFCDTKTDPHRACEKRVFLDPNGHSQLVWLRSRKYSSYVYYVDPYGYINYNGPSYNCGVLAACVIAGREVQQALLSDLLVHK